MTKVFPSFFHLHLVSDSTGETLTTIAKAASVQYSKTQAIQHVHPLVRTKRQLERVFEEIKSKPGIVLYTIIGKELAQELEQKCKEINVPCVAALNTVLKVFESYLGMPVTPKIGGQHVLDSDYFRRIDALNFTMVHDDGHLPEDIGEADIIIVGISRTSKTPTSIYLANRGYKTANVPLIPEISIPVQLENEPHKTFVVGLIASIDNIASVRHSRVMTMGDENLDSYIDKGLIREEIKFTRRLCSKYKWPVIDVTRRSIEETAAAILSLYHSRQIETF